MRTFTALHGTVPVLLHVPHAGLESFFDSSDIETGRIAEEMGAVADLNTDWIAKLASSAMEGTPYLLQSNMTRMECDVEQRLRPHGRMDDEDTGAIYRMGANGADDPLYSHEIPQGVIDYRFGALYMPYHRMFASMIVEMIERFGFAAIINIHSHGDNQPCCGPYPYSGGRSEIRVVVNNPADESMVGSIIHDRWRRRCLSCMIGSIACGSFTPEGMGDDSRVHSVMLEIRKDTYMDDHIPMYADMDALGGLIASLSSGMMEILDSDRLDRPSAMEPGIMIPAADTR